MSSDSRLDLARARLSEIAERGAVGEDDVSGALRVIWVALDFVEIAHTLPAERVKAVRQGIETALRGPLWPESGARQALQFQTQHWIGALLRRSGIELEVPTYSSRRSRKSPDFLISDGILPIPLEVKRPERARRIAPSVLDACEQLRAGGTPGGVLLELSDCLPHDDAGTFERQAGALTDIARTVVWREDGRGFRPGRQWITFLGVIGRGARLIDPADPSRLGAFAYSSAATFSDPPNTVHDRKAQRLHAYLIRAFSGMVDRVAAFGIAPFGA